MGEDFTPPTGSPAYEAAAKMLSTQEFAEKLALLGTSTQDSDLVPRLASEFEKCYTQLYRKVREDVKKVHAECDEKLRLLHRKQNMVPDLEMSICVAAVHPPYPEMLLELNRALESTDQAMSHRSRRFEKARSRIAKIAAALEVDVPPVPDDLRMETIIQQEELQASFEAMYKTGAADVLETTSKCKQMCDQLSEPMPQEAREAISEPGEWAGPTQRGVLTALNVALQGKVESQTSITKALLARACELSQLLGKSEEDRTSFDLKHQGISVSDHAMLRKAIAAFEQERTERLPDLIVRAREEIANLWAGLYVQPDFDGLHQRLGISSEDISEPALRSLESERRRLMELSKNLSNILTPYSTLLELRIIEVQLNELTSDPKRFGRRGYSPLKEERMRTRVTKKPAILQALKVRLMEWELTHDPVLIYGRRLLELVDEEEASNEANRSQSRIASRSVGLQKSTATTKSGILSRPFAAVGRAIRNVRTNMGHSRTGVVNGEPETTTGTSRTSGLAAPSSVPAKLSASRRFARPRLQENLPISRKRALPPSTGKENSEEGVTTAPSSDSRVKHRKVEAEVTDMPIGFPASQGSLPSEDEEQGDDGAYERWRIEAISRAKARYDGLSDSCSHTAPI